MIKALNVSINANVLFVKFIECFMYNLEGILQGGYSKMRQNEIITGRKILCACKRQML